jgi:hypothetical protein
VKREQIARTALTLRLDRETYRLHALLAECHIDSVLLKGPVLRSWLYGGQDRVYGDIDLLVSPTAEEGALALLGEQGYKDPFSGASRVETAMHARTLVNQSGMTVDLHTTLSGVHVRTEEVWSLLRPDAMALPLAGGEVLRCGDVARLLIVVLHAAQHGIEESKPLEDLARAISISADREVRAAHALALRLEARDSFAAGLRLNADAKSRFPDLCRHRGDRLTEARARSGQNYPGLLVLAGATSGSARYRLRVVARSAWPTRTYINAHYPGLAGTSWGRMRARGRRLRYQMRQLPSAVRAFRGLGGAS